jgi:cobalt-zinc-cadmium efflux system outer membrane protein
MAEVSLFQNKRGLALIYGRFVAAVLAAAMVPMVSVTAQTEIPGNARVETGMETFGAAAPKVHERRNPSHSPILTSLIAEALENNPEIQAAHRERDAAAHRIAPASALDDPVLEAGVINAPLTSSPFNREDMTMKMIGLSQRLPFPGKRSLRKEVATKDAESVGHGYQETVNRVVREIRIAYFDLALTLERTRIVEKNKLILEDLAHIAEQHYGVGLGSQTDALKAQTQVSRMVDELLALARERPVLGPSLYASLAAT